MILAMESSPFSVRMIRTELDRLNLATRNRLYQAQQRFRIGSVGQVFFPICGFQFQSVPFCHRLASFLFQPFFKLIPVFSGCLIIGLPDQSRDNIDDRKIPPLILLIAMTRLNGNRLVTMNARQHIRQGVFGLRRIVIGLQTDPKTIAGAEEARQA